MANKVDTIIEKRMSSILPNRQDTACLGSVSKERASLISKATSSIIAEKDAKALAAAKYKEKQRLAAAERAENEARIKEAKERVEAVEQVSEAIAVASESLDVRNVARAANITDKQLINNALRLQGASRPEIQRLLQSLNINVSLQLTKADTANLLACLLTCNETQLTALLSNRKIPLVIKTIIKRLIEDERLGNIDTIERLWDRVFGKGPMQLTNLPEQQTQMGILPNQPISREAYVIIRETLIGQ